MTTVALKSIQGRSRMPYTFHPASKDPVVSVNYEYSLSKTYSPS